MANEEDDSKIFFHGNPRIGTSFPPNIIAHGLDIPGPMYSNTLKLFHENIHQGLGDLEQVCTFLTYVWPALMEQSNVCMVNSIQSCKTTAYLPYITSMLLDKEERYANLPPHPIGPICIIVCSGINLAKIVHFQFTHLIRFATDELVCTVAVPPLDEKCLAQFENQCDLLITTPKALITLFDSKVISAARLCCLVIENCDIVVNRFSTEVNMLMKYVNDMLSNRKFCYGVQVVLTAKHWTGPLENFLKYLHIPPGVFIEDCLEAAIYGRVDIQMHFSEPIQKTLNIVGILKATSEDFKTIIICNNQIEMNTLKLDLTKMDVNFIAIDDGMPNYKMLQLGKRWRRTGKGQHLVMVCTHRILNWKLKVTTASILIYYTLPEKWKDFTARLNCFTDNYTVNPLFTITENLAVKCKVHVFVDETDQNRFPMLVHLMFRMGAHLNCWFQRYCNEAIAAKEEKNLAFQVKLCPDLKLHGECLSSIQELIREDKQDSKFALTECKWRHLLVTDVDYSYKLPNSGRIKFNIIEVINVTQFKIHIIEHMDMEGNRTIVKGMCKFQENLQRLMHESKECVRNVTINKWYVYYFKKTELYYRCCLQEIFKTDSVATNLLVVSIKLLDYPSILNVSVADLFELPEVFRLIPPEVIDIYLANTTPPELDDCWSSDAIIKVKILLEKANFEKNIVYGIGQILLQLDNCLYLKNVMLCETSSSTNETVIKLNLRKALKHTISAEYCEDQLDRLYRLCNNANIPLPCFNMNKQVKPKWAYIGKTKYVDVYIVYLDTPSLFYLQLKRECKLFQKLQAEIQEALIQPFFPKEFQVAVDKCYLAPDTRSYEFTRVKVLKVEGNYVSCLYVDYGNTNIVSKSKLKYLPNEFISKLQFQAIECRLYGIVPIAKDWKLAATAIMRESMFEPDGITLRVLYATVCSHEISDATGGKKYAVLLFASFNDVIKILNEELVERDQAIQQLTEMNDLRLAALEESLDISDIDNIPEELFKTSETKEAILLKTRKGKVRFKIEVETIVEQLENPDKSQNIAKDPSEQLAPSVAGPSSSNSGYNTPKATWYQTKEYVKLNIMLTQATNIKITVTTNTIFTFTALCDNKTYHLNLRLFQRVQKRSRYSNFTSSVNVTLTKVKANHWPRLVFSDRKELQNIEYDISECPVREELENAFVKIGGTDIIQNIKHDNGSDESSESESE